METAMSAFKHAWNVLRRVIRENLLRSGIPSTGLSPISFDGNSIELSQINNKPKTKYEILPKYFQALTERANHIVEGQILLSPRGVVKINIGRKFEVHRLMRNKKAEHTATEITTEAEAANESKKEFLLISEELDFIRAEYNIEPKRLLTIHDLYAVVILKQNAHNAKYDQAKKQVKHIKQKIAETVLLADAYHTILDEHFT